MAELNSSAGSLRGKGRTSTLSPKVDMTPMVDLMFLLITFFMLTTSLAKPFMMSLAMPVGETPGLEVADNRTMNICIGKDNSLQWYMGKADSPLTSPHIINFSIEGLRKTLNTQNKRVQQLTRSREKGVIVLIKPTDKSNYKNLVDVLDELKITGIDNYMIVDALPKDIERMKSSAIY
ncbi:ExbD/TolR family protein [Desertivirga arenae]|uniref:ExbD/TolR family protein n=1 Tax=Desertivirga arenae TaxID=2810309 RepID=UPI001A956E64|nr:biopolymer transporter ExbD [Pedobacter sp. SYSU D00823]